ncbi:MAG: hypothetical protein RL274_2382 [Pseudomonadota bacterium]
MRRKVILTVVALLVCATSSVAVWAAASSDKVVALRRLTEPEYRNSIADIFGKDIVVQGMFEPGIRMGGMVAASSTVLSVTPVGFGSFSKMADSIAVQVTGEKMREKLVFCAPKSAKAPDDDCAADFFRHYGLMLYRRPLTADELKAQVSLANAMSKKTGDFYTGLRYGLAGLLQSPEFLFRKEVAVNAGGKGYTLEPYSRATRLSYLMWGTTPDTELLHAAATGELNAAAGLEKQVDRLLASPRLEAGMRAFFTDFLMLGTFDSVSKDALLYPKWGGAMAPSAREEALRSLVKLALHDNGDMRDLMITRKTFINRSLAAIYNVDFSFDSEWMPYEFTPDSGRSGVLTQVAMLSMFSHPGQSSPTKRGVALNEIFLCEPTPTPPNNVDFSIINETNGPMKTVRERLMAHAEEKICSSCHNAVDPIGLSLEGFDTIGGRRERENGELIDVSATLQGKTFSGADGLGKFLHDNPKYPACVARKLYSYANGVNAEEADASLFRAGYEAFKASGYRLRALLRGLVVSPEFFSSSTSVEEASASHIKTSSP